LLDKGDPDASQGLDLNGNARAAAATPTGSRDATSAPLSFNRHWPGRQPEVGTSGGPAADATAPVISGFRATKSRVRVAHVTRFRYVLSESARVTLRFKRIGRRGRLASAGTLKRTGSKGLNRIRFTGRIGRRALRAGRYRAVLTATDTAGNSSAPSRTRFRIVP
jgi:hypothetical protein